MHDLSLRCSSHAAHLVDAVLNKLGPMTGKAASGKPLSRQAGCFGHTRIAVMVISLDLAPNDISGRVGNHGSGQTLVGYHAS